jgi:hypothetical protein
LAESTANADKLRRHGFGAPLLQQAQVAGASVGGLVGDLVTNAVGVELGVGVGWDVVEALGDGVPDGSGLGV